MPCLGTNTEQRVDCKYLREKITEKRTAHLFGEVVLQFFQLPEFRLNHIRHGCISEGGFIYAITAVGSFTGRLLDDWRRFGLSKWYLDT